MDFVKTRVFVSCPFNLLVDQFLPRFLSERLQPEIGLNGGPLDQYTIKDFKKVSGILEKEGLRCTVHAPFIDLSMGAIDRKVRNITLERLKKAVDIASIFDAKSLVCHTGFDKKHYMNLEDKWLSHAIDSFIALLDYASFASFPIMIENVFELDPEIHKKILQEIGSERLGFCMDVGHQEVFSETSMLDWLNKMEEFLAQLHLHDNMGETDDHRAIGRGVIDFESLFLFLSREGLSPIITLEVHRPEEVMPSLETLKKLLERYPI